MNFLPNSKDVVLLGGGHAHVIVIRKWAMAPIEGVRLTLISEQGMTPYSGMLPGLVAGHYSYTQSHIDLPRLCQWAGVRFIEKRATGLDPENQKVLLADRPALHYDILSIDTGGAPALHTVKGADQFATAVKPVSSFYSRWQQIEQRLDQNKGAGTMRIGVVGAGAGGFEILLAVQHRIASATRSAQHQLYWIIRGEVLPGATERVRKFALEACREKGIKMETSFDVSEVRSDRLLAVDGRDIALDEVLWCTEAKAAEWPAKSDIACDDEGFVLTNDFLQSVSHKNIFAVGDVAVQENNPRPRAGVFAVRQGPPLFRNLQRAALEKKLVEHHPQHQFLTLLSLGNKRAIASKSAFSVVGDWVWQWKDHIDQTFMNRFNMLPEMPTEPKPLISRLLQAIYPASRVLPQNGEPMRCLGCGSKVPGDILNEVLTKITASADDGGSNVGLGSDDIAIVHTKGKDIAQSLDQLRAILDDPWLFARIATLHALSDLYASSVLPHSALLNVTLPFSSEAILRSDLSQIIDGVTYELERAGALLIGGHTTEGAELSLGLAVNGIFGEGVDNTDVSTLGKGGAVAGQVLVLSKPLGIGVLMATHMRGQLTANHLQAAVQLMLFSNKEAARIALESGATSMTDVTGFGLIGHLSEILLQSSCSAVLSPSEIPVLKPAHLLAQSGQHSSLYQANLRYSRYCDDESAEILRENCPLAFDPQTSGGLLFSLPESHAASCLEMLHLAGYSEASVIGKLQEEGSALSRSSAAKTECIRVVTGASAWSTAYN